MVESLSKKLEHERRMGRLPEIEFTWGIKEINHSQFADDTLILIASSSIIEKKFKRVLHTFLSSSSSKINSHKSKLIGSNFVGNKLWVISRVLGFLYFDKITSFIYLGMPSSFHKLTSQSQLLALNKMATIIQYRGSHWPNPIGKRIIIRSIL